MIAYILYHLDRLALWYADKRGRVIVDASEYHTATSNLMDAWEQVVISGHLNTVSGRKPHVVKRLSALLQGAYINLIRGRHA